MSFVTESIKSIVANETSFLESYQCLLEENRGCSEEIQELKAPFWLTFIVAGVALVIAIWLHFVYPQPQVLEKQKSKKENWYKNTQVWKGVLFQFFLNLCILGVLHVGHEKDWNEKGYEIFGSVCLGAILITCLAIVLHKLKTEESNEEDKQIPTQSNEKDKQTPMQQMKAKDSFQDLAKSFSQAFLVFVAEAILLGMYIWALFDQDVPQFSDRRIYTYYWIGAILQAAYVADKEKFVFQMAEQFAKDWHKIIDFASSCVEFYAIDDDDKEIHDIGARRFVWVRFGLSFLVNVVGYWIIIFGLPVQLSSSRNPYDFVLNAVAAYFIIELDDYDSAKTMEEIGAIKVEQTETQDVDPEAEESVKVVADDSFVAEL